MEEASKDRQEPIDHLAQAGASTVDYLQLCQRPSNAEKSLAATSRLTCGGVQLPPPI